jgi:hypothetical protein
MAGKPIARRYSKYWASSLVAGGEEENTPSPGRTLTFPLTELQGLCIKPLQFLEDNAFHRLAEVVIVP